MIEQLEEAIKEYGEPEHLRSDSGSEFIAYAAYDWFKGSAVIVEILSENLATGGPIGGLGL